LPRKVNIELDHQVLEYLKDHSWLQTQDHFGLSSRTIKLIKDRNGELDPSIKESINTQINTELKEDIEIMIKLFYKAIEIPDFLKILSSNEEKAISRLEMVK
jgi:hypothetical protein